MDVVCTLVFLLYILLAIDLFNVFQTWRGKEGSKCCSRRVNCTRQRTTRCRTMMLINRSVKGWNIEVTDISENIWQRTLGFFEELNSSVVINVPYLSEDFSILAGGHKERKREFSFSRYLFSQQGVDFWRKENRRTWRKPLSRSHVEIKYQPT